MSYDPMKSPEGPQCFSCGRECEAVAWDEDLQLACCGRPECITNLDGTSTCDLCADCLQAISPAAPLEPATPIPSDWTMRACEAAVRDWPWIQRLRYAILDPAIIRNAEDRYYRILSYLATRCQRSSRA